MPYPYAARDNRDYKHLVLGREAGRSIGVSRSRPHESMNQAVDRTYAQKALAEEV